MKFTRTSLFILSIILTSYHVDAQQILAGTNDTNTYYYDYSPDLTFQAKASDPTHLYPQGYQHIDIDRDGNTDFILETTSGGTSQTGWCYGRLNCIDAGASILAHYESSLVSPNTYDSLLVPDQLSLNSIINNQSGNYLHAAAYVWSTPFGNFTGPWVASWNNVSDRYIGLKLNSNGNTMYAWLHITLDFTNNVFSLSLHDFACMKNPLVDYSVPLNNGIVEGNSETQILTYPVPSSNQLSLAYTGNLQVESVSVYDMQGHLMMNQAGGVTRWSIPVSSWANGCYLVRLHTAAGDVQKVIIKE